MAKHDEENVFRDLPPSAVVFIERVIKKMRYSRKARLEVQAELIGHFEDGLRECPTEQEKEEEALRIIADFGEIRLLAILLRRAKKRCRPLWKTAVVRTVQAAAILFVTLILYSVWFLTGKPVIDVDYAAMLNNLNRPELRDEDNAWPNYEQAASLFKEPNDPDFKKKIAYNVGGGGEQIKLADLSDSERKRLVAWVRLNDPAWEAFETGAAKPYCYKEYRHDPNDEERWLMDIHLTYFSEIRNIARLGIWRSRIAAEQGRLSQALSDPITVALTASHWQRKVNLIEQLVGTSITGMACREIANILEDHSLSAEVLREAYSQFSEVYRDGFAHVNVEGERLIFMDTVQHVFTKGGIGGGHLIPSAWTYLADDHLYSLEGQDKLLFMPLFAAESMLHARRDETVARANEFYSRHKDLVKKSPYQREMAAMESSGGNTDSLPHRRFFLLEFMSPAFGRASEIRFRGQAFYQATVTILAIKWFRAEKGRYPGSLDELLSAGFIDELPMDPYSDKPLAYKKTNGSFTLYSLGPNLEDDKAEPGRTKRGRLKEWQNNGDTVFWPVPKSEP